MTKGQQIAASLSSPEVNMLTGKNLIDKARVLGFSDAYVADRIGVSRSYLSHVAADRKTLSPEAAAMLAVICGEDATEALKAQTVANEKDPERKEKLRRALFRTAALGGRSLAADIAVYTS
jgi:transcriptional regulator with XRE-family HTH domain